MACAFCRYPDFLAYLQEIDPKHQRWTEGGAKEFILATCQISSRSELDRDERAALRFHELVRAPYLAWKASTKENL
jgi:hypothetical protein